MKNLTLALICMLFTACADITIQDGANNAPDAGTPSLTVNVYEANHDVIIEDAPEEDMVDTGMPDDDTNEPQTDAGQPETAQDASAQEHSPMPNADGCYLLDEYPNPAFDCTPGCWYVDGSRTPYHGQITSDICVRNCLLSGQLTDMCMTPLPDPLLANGVFYYCSSGGIGEGCCTTGNFAQDYDVPLASMLIKSASSETVYYYGSDGKRYVFPNADVIISWYGFFGQGSMNTDVCPTVREFPDSVIATIPIGGNVTIRPGTYLVRIATDPKIYAVESSRTLRWIGQQDQPTSGYPVTGVASEIFSDPENLVRIIPDAFFVNYLIGQSIDNASAYSPEFEIANSTIESVLGI